MNNRTDRILFSVLVLAGIYNLVWGAFVILLPHKMFVLAGMDLPRYPEIWQCVGMIVGVYGVGYIIAATDHRRHWPIVLVGLLGKLLGPIGFGKALLDGTFTPAFGVNIIFNDLIWWLPFGYALYDTYRSSQQTIKAGVLTASAPEQTVQTPALPAYQSDCPNFMSTVVYENFFPANADQMDDIWDKLNRRETFVDGQLFPFRVEFAAHSQSGPFASGELNIHHGPLLSVHGAIGEVSERYRSLDYFYGAYLLSFRLIRPTKLEFIREDAGIKLKIHAYMRPWVRPVWLFINNVFWKIFGVTFLFSGKD